MNGSGSQARTRVDRSALLWALLVVGSAAAYATGAQDPRRDDLPLAPAAALASFELEPGYRIELVAAEPLIRSPVAVAFDERGRLYVVENRGYPGPLEGAPQPPPEGGIALLEDTNADGRFDTRTDFATRLSHPNGIMPWNGGVFVTAAPDLLYLKDLDGDGVADERRVALTGFAATRTPQIRFSHPTLGIDNWVYLTSGLNGGRVTAPDHPDRAPIEFTASDSRFNPFTLAFELTGGRSQFGLTFDDYGRRFTCANRHPVWHVVLEPRYLKRNPHFAFSETVHEVSAVGARATVWPISRDMTTASFMPSLIGAPHAGTFTAASGVHIHRGDALPASDRGSVFICESAQNLVQRQVLSPAGVTFSSRPARGGREFLASRDPWFRPVFAANGPDGALYIVDMYRRNIDHPQYLPEASRPLLDFDSGKDHGRIFRIVAADWTRSSRTVDLARLDPAALVDALEHPNAWHRETAQRLIVERRQLGATPHLRKMAAEGRSAVSRIHALWTLDGLNALQATDVQRAMGDAHSVVRENAVRLAESRVRASEVLFAILLKLATDEDARVRFRTALALGEVADARAVDALAAIARRDGGDAWTRAAVLSSIGQRSHEFLRAFVRAPSASAVVRPAVTQDLGRIFGAAETPERCLDLLLAIAGADGDFGWQPAALAGLAEGLEARGKGARGSALLAMVSADPARAVEARTRLEAVVQRSIALATDERASTDLRVSAIAFLGYTDDAVAGKTLAALIAPQQTAAIQVAAVRALCRLADPAAAAAVVEADRWRGFTPEVREAALSALVSAERHASTLLDALDKGAIAPAEIGPQRRSRLTNHRDPVIQTRARAIFAAVNAGDRMQAFERLRETVLKLTGDESRGRAAFSRHCLTCHALDGGTRTLGPDLSGIRNQPPEAILLHTLVPDFEVTAGYEGYVVETRDGRTLVGRLVSEAPNSITLREASSQEHVILRGQIRSMAASRTSLMPGGLDQVLSSQDLADLIQYLKSERAPAGSAR
jgi:putative membrane-bound dehydrogenase-like protein